MRCLKPSSDYPANLNVLAKDSKTSYFTNHYDQMRVGYEGRGSGSEMRVGDEGQMLRCFSALWDSDTMLPSDSG